MSEALKYWYFHIFDMITMCIFLANHKSLHSQSSKRCEGESFLLQHALSSINSSSMYNPMASNSCKINQLSWHGNKCDHNVSKIMLHYSRWLHLLLFSTAYHHTSIIINPEKTPNWEKTNMTWHVGYLDLFTRYSFCAYCSLHKFYTSPQSGRYLTTSTKKT